MHNTPLQMSGAGDLAFSSPAATESFRNLKYYEGPAEIEEDVKLSHRYFTYSTDAGIVAGSDFNVMFTIDRPASAVWRCFKDFNRWQKSHHSYTKVLGDIYYREDGALGEERFGITAGPDGPLAPHQYQVVKVVPERLLVIYQPIVSNEVNGGVSRGFHSFMLNEHGGETVVTGLMNHAARATAANEDEALELWRKITEDGHRKWRDNFIPTLKRLVREEK